MFETASTMLGRVVAYERATALARTQRLRGAERSRAALVQETDRVFKKAALDALQLRELWLAVWSTVENLNDAELAQVGDVLRGLFTKWQAVLADMGSVTCKTCGARCWPVRRWCTPPQRN